MVSQAEEKYINTSLSSITKVTVNSPTRGNLILTQLCRSEVVSHHNFYLLYFLSAEPQSLQNTDGYSCPFLSMS